MKKDLIVIRDRGFALQVCTNAKSYKLINRLANQKSRCGTRNGWAVDEKESKRLGQSKVICVDDPTRIHIILYA